MRLAIICHFFPQRRMSHWRITFHFLGQQSKRSGCYSRRSPSDQNPGVGSWKEQKKQWAETSASEQVNCKCQDFLVFAKHFSFVWVCSNPTSSHCWRHGYFLNLQAEKQFEVRLKDLQLSLDQSESHKQSIQNYVDFLKNSYTTMFDEGLQASCFGSSYFLKWQWIQFPFGDHYALLNCYLKNIKDIGKVEELDMFCIFSLFSNL